MSPKIVDGNTKINLLSANIIIINNDRFALYSGKIKIKDNGCISLNELKQKIDKDYIQVIAEEPFEGWIYTYDHTIDDSWYLTGTTFGYAYKELV